MSTQEEEEGHVDNNVTKSDGDKMNSKTTTLACNHCNTEGHTAKSCKAKVCFYISPTTTLHEASKFNIIIFRRRMRLNKRRKKQNRLH